MNIPEGTSIYLVQVLVTDREFKDAEEVISSIDATLPGGMEVISAELSDA